MPAKRQAISSPALPAPPSSKRSRHSRALAQPRVSIPTEIFRMLADLLRANHGTLLKLGSVCRSARDAVFRNHALWYEILRRHQSLHFTTFTHSHTGPSVVRGIPMSPYPNFKLVEGSLRPVTFPPPMHWQKKKLAWPHLQSVAATGEFSKQELAAFAEHAVKCARMHHDLRCGVCGSKDRHIPVWGLHCRVCTPCFKGNLVSSAVLMHEYGVDFTRHAEAIAGRVFFFRHIFHSRFAVTNLTDNPVDFRQDNDKCLVFFWAPHLRRVLDLDAAKAGMRCPVRRGAASRLTACVRALCVRLMAGQRGRGFAMASSHKFFTHAPSAPKRPGGHYTDMPLDEEQLASLAANLPHCYTREALLSQEAAARALLQRSFLAFRGNLHIPAAKSAGSVVERLRMIEALREGQCIRLRTPSFYCTDKKFRAWQDMPVPSHRVNEL